MLRRVIAVFGRNRLKSLRTGVGYSRFILTFPSVLSSFDAFDRVPSRPESPKNQGVRRDPRCELFRNVRKMRNVQKVSEM